MGEGGGTRGGCDDRSPTVTRYVTKSLGPRKVDVKYRDGRRFRSLGRRRGPFPFSLSPLSCERRITGTEFSLCV